MDEPEPIPWLSKDKLAYYGPFRDNVRAFVKNETEPDDYYVEGGVLGHTVTLAKGTKYETNLRVYEETMLESTRVHCDCCRCIGWHHHPVTRKQYHFIIHTDFRTDLKPELKGKRICQICTAAMPIKEKKCISCGEKDCDTSILDYQTHLMHGTLHANGCGHLKRINGREAGSRVLSGQQLIQIWEKICHLLRAREVSVEDVSQKYGVEFRLLNPVACGKTWYGTFGYQFGKGSFGNTGATHRKAAERLRGFTLENVRADFKAMGGTNPGAVSAWVGAGGANAYAIGAAGSLVTGNVLEVISRYEKIMGKYAPKTLGDLVSLLLRLQRIVRKKEKARRDKEMAAQRKANKSVGGIRIKEEGLAREAAAKRKAASSIFEPLKFETKLSKASKMSKTNGGTGTPGKVMSSAKPRALPPRPLRPRGADGLVPASDVKDEPEEAKPAKKEPPPPKKKKEKEKEPKKKKEKKELVPGAPVVSRWSDARIEIASNACVEVLREAGGKWLPRQEVRGLARAKGVGDTGLLDHVLKSISERKVVLRKRPPANAKAATKPVPKGQTIRAHIRRRQNASSGQLEYQLESVPGMSKMQASIILPPSKKGPKPTPGAAPGGGKGAVVANGKGKVVHLTEAATMDAAADILTKEKISNDVKVVYKNLLESYKPARARPGRPLKGTAPGEPKKCHGSDLIHAARVLLDTKQFVKTYCSTSDMLALRPPASATAGKSGRPPMVSKGVRVMVTAVIDSRNKGPKVSGLSIKEKKKLKYGIETKPPPEVILLPPEPMLCDLKNAVNKVFSDLYVVLAKYRVRHVIGFESTQEKARLNAKKIAGASLEVLGDGADLESDFRYQGGLDQWIVRCVCGTCDDDGERMIACDVCEVWMHTRCVGISDSENTPRRWTCKECIEDEAEAAKNAPPPPPPHPRERPPPTKRRPPPERIMKRRKATKM